MDASARNTEAALRIMAAENRTRRRALGHSVIDAMAIAESMPSDRFARGILPVRGAADPDCAYILLFFPFLDPGLVEEGYDRYREIRSSTLATYCYAILRKNRHLKRAIGIAMEGPGRSAHGSTSEDLILLEIFNWSDEMVAESIEREKLLNVLEEGRVKYQGYSVQEYPTDKVSRQVRRARERRAEKARRRKDLS